MRNDVNSSITLVVGGIYKDREGTSVTIVSDEGQKPYVFQSDGMESYTAEGRYDVDEPDCSMDLVEVVPQTFLLLYGCDNDKWLVDASDPIAAQSVFNDAVAQGEVTGEVNQIFRLVDVTPQERT